MACLVLKVLIRGAGELATGVSCRLARSHFLVCMTEVSAPEAVRRGVAFSEAIDEGAKEVEGITAKLVASPDQVPSVWDEGKVPLIIDPEARIKDILRPDVLVDAILAKRNLGTHITDAPLLYPILCVGL